LGDWKPHQKRQGKKNTEGGQNPAGGGGKEREVAVSKKTETGKITPDNQKESENTQFGEAWGERYAGEKRIFPKKEDPEKALG